MPRRLTSEPIGDLTQALERLMLVGPLGSASIFSWGRASPGQFAIMVVA